MIIKNIKANIMAIDYSQLAGMNYDKTSPELSEGAVWAAKQVYGAIQNIDYGLMWILDKNGFLIDNPVEVNAYSKRFTHQWLSTGTLLFSTVAINNPIRKIVTYIVTEYAKRRPLNTIGNVIKGVSSVGLKSTASALTIKKIISAIVKQIVIQIIAKQTVQKAITSVASAIGGIYISMQGLQMQSFDSIRGLRIMKPKVYGYLYKHNMETFWFLVQPHLTNMMKHIN